MTQFFTGKSSLTCAHCSAGGQIAQGHLESNPYKGAHATLTCPKCLSVTKVSIVTGPWNQKGRLIAGCVHTISESTRIHRSSEVVFIETHNADTIPEILTKLIFAAVEAIVHTTI